MSTIALVASRIPPTELHSADVSLRGLTHALIPEIDSPRLNSEADWRRLTHSVYYLPFITLGRPDRKLGFPTTGCYGNQQYPSGERSHGNIRLRLPSNDGLQTRHNICAQWLKSVLLKNMIVINQWSAYYFFAIHQSLNAAPNSTKSNVIKFIHMKSGSTQWSWQEKKKSTISST
jgi:hypothetical protein